MSDPSNVLDLAGACVAAVQNAVGVELDFTQDTLPLLDHYVSLVKAPREEILDLVAPMCGAYFGEVVRRYLGPSHWHAPDGDFVHWRLELEVCFLSFNPVGIAIEAITHAQTDGWGANLDVLERDRAAVAIALERYGDVREEDFFRFGVRFEAIEQAYEALARRAVEHGEVGVRYGRDAYEAAEAARSTPKALN